MNTTTPRCPRCRGALRAGAVHDIDLAICPDCEGVLVQQRRLIALMEAMTAEIAEALELDHPLEPLPVGEGPGPCPLCEQQLVSFGYLGTHLVTIDRCPGCEVIWADTEELGVMSLLYARTERRVQASRARSTVKLASLEQRVQRILKIRARDRLLFGGFF